ncbi:uncharacterized protein LOC100822944 isoform X1 [Brachypodium distachyon]|uniref:Uncharacterized protein n=1 Tax=Brachypodium distachyon TaxID=15368 RepID=I1HM40_BRADI|nr:uncharacterized protein LOC100822944 isoform X1 [Brachypodium distachyon]KQK07635.1 hypothetical protein BRADI_2g36720v3 [Brachypodium distachyon]PNT71876.1 hypothetical protein BRADI_2g36720v3 [Brachypodium distachyon]|eukprot:XP_003566590.1 uncharacterized protein LOC100822944 isoform X1 [Brachypodium distachyon]
MASREEPIDRRFADNEEEDDDLVGDDSGDEVLEVRRRVSRFAVGAGDDDVAAAGDARNSRRVSRFAAEGVFPGPQHDRRRRDSGCELGGGGRKITLPPPHAWLAVEETMAKKKSGSDGNANGNGSNEEQWARLLASGSEGVKQQEQPRRSSFSAVRRERAAREAWLDRAWEMKRSWHERSGGAPDADTPVVVLLGGKQQPSSPCSSSSSSSPHAAAGVGVAMDMEEVRACRDLGLELPADCTVEIQCYGISGSPTHSNSSGGGGGSDSPSNTSGSCSISSPGTGEDPVEVKARLKVWAQAVALASTTHHLGS